MPPWITSGYEEEFMGVQYPVRCRIIDPTGEPLEGTPYRMNAPAKSLPHVGKEGLAEKVESPVALEGLPEGWSVSMPGRVRITLDDGNILYGDECWWVPLDDRPTPAH